MSTPRLLYPYGEAAEQLGISQRVLERLIRDGEIESVPIGRRKLVPAEALTDYVERLRRSA